MMYTDFDLGRIMPIFDIAEDVRRGKGKHAKVYIEWAGATFDIETTSFYENGEKRAIPYAFMITFYNKNNEKVTYLYRRIEDVVKLFNLVTQELQTKFSGRLICYIHNAAFDLAFCQTYFNISEMFCNGDKRSIMFARTPFIEFRCSLMLTCLPLSALSKETTESKLTMDYDLLRNPLTDISEDLDYMEADTTILASFFAKKMNSEGGIANLPYTKTGYPRRRFAKHCLNDKQYRRLIRELTLDMDELDMWEDAFQGGLTRANAYYANKVVKDVDSYDLTSAYPSVFYKSYPMSKGRLITVSSKTEAEEYMSKFHCLFMVKLTDIECLYPFPIISKSKVKYFEGDLEEMVVDNGRIAQFEGSIYLICEEVTFRMIKNVYNIGDWEIKQMYIYEKGLLPKPFLEVVNQLYFEKTTFKGMKGVNPDTNHDYAEDLQQSKADLNGSYGMMCMHVIMEEMELDFNEEFSCLMMNDVEYDNNYDEYQARMLQLDNYNKSNTRFTFYAWASYVTAYVREILLSAMLECTKIDENPKSDTYGKILVNDWIYSDTDSVKIINKDRHEKYFENFNNSLYDVYSIVCNQYGWSMDTFEPKDRKGNKHLLGSWDYEGCEGCPHSYIAFKTLGVKRYAYLEYNEKKGENEFHITVSGLKKHGKLKVEESKALGYNVYEYGANDYIWEHGGFDFFTDDMVVPAEYSGRIIHTYIDHRTEGDITDYQGHKYHYIQNTGIHLEKSDYNLKMHEYLDYVFKTQEINL